MFETLPGFRDFPPEACAQRNHIFRVFRNVARAFDFREYDAPILEPLDLFIEKSGPEIVSQLFHFQDKGERAVALRPELTPTLARMVANRANSLPKPIKWYNIGEHFRYERPQKGRGRSFYQFNADLLGEDSVGADAELIALLCGIMETLGLGQNQFALRLSDRQTWLLFLESIGIAEGERSAILDVIDKSERRKPEQNSEALDKIIPGRGNEILSQVDELKQINQLDSLLIKLSSFGQTGQTRANDWRALMDHLEAHQVSPFIKIDLSIVRGLAYYTGFVYEAFEASGEGRALAGGGRYDHLIKKLSGNIDLPAAGFAIGDMTLTDCLEKNGLLPSYVMVPDIFLICGSEQSKTGISIVANTRKAGFSVSHPLKESSFGKQFKEAGKSGARYALILGEEEELKKKVKIKDLKSSGEIAVDQSHLIQQLEKLDEEGGIDSSS
ncbi:MAG: histidine--tRNA ligase [Verrucomicrobiota bacterium]|nr:histidine--tRNA ligase [Verrucomicrobiota bacterium]